MTIPHRIRQVLAALVLGLLVWAGSSPWGHTQSIQNPGCETTTTDDENASADDPANWTEEPDELSTGLTTIQNNWFCDDGSVVAPNPRTGSGLFAVEATTSDTDLDFNLQQDIASVKLERVYELSGFIQTRDGDEAQLILEFLDGGGNVLTSTGTGLVSPGNAWTQHSVSEAAPSNAASIRVRLVVRNSGTNPGNDFPNGFFDDLSLSVTGYERTIVGTDGTGNDTGWRLLATPAAGVTRGNLEDDVVGFDNLDSGHLLHTWAGDSWNAATSSGVSLPRGQGFILYFFDDSTDPLTSTGVPLDVPTGSEDQSVDKTVSGLNNSAPFHLLGNPYPVKFDLTELRDASGNSLSSAPDFQSAVQVWDPEANSGNGQFITITEDGGSTSSDAIAAWQGIFVERANTGSGDTELTFNTQGKLSGTGDLIGSKSRATEFRRPVRALVDLELTVTSETDTLAGDGATVLFEERAAAGWDTFEATQLAPPISSAYVTMSGPLQRSDGGDATLVRRTQASIPYPRDTTAVTVPLSVRSVKVNGTGTIAWPAAQRDRVPDDWTITLVDRTTETTVDLREQAYGFDVSDGAGALSTPDDARFALRVEPGSVLPVELASFRAHRDGETVRLTWTTASETNNAGFYVQRRVETRERGDREAWERVGFIDGAGTTQEPQTYRFADPNLPFGAETLVYRLRQVDTDGTVHLSDSRVVRRDAPREAVLKAPFPNPARQQVTLRYAVPASGDVQIALYDVLGRVMATWADRRVEAGRHAQTIPLGTLAPGTYFMRMKTDDTVRTRRLTVVR